MSAPIVDDAKAGFLAYPGSLEHCGLCPRSCGARRSEGMRGFCGAGRGVLVARAALHFWEEPPISGQRGSGAIFFSNCPLRCVFCQNAQISAGGYGTEVSVERLGRIMLELQEQGAHNINLVTATHYAPQVRAATIAARGNGLELPVVYNTSGYELPRAIEALDGVVDIWLPDYKYADPSLARRLSSAPDYPEVALRAIGSMVGQVSDRGGRSVAEDGVMERGVIVRHLVLPGHADDSMRALSALWEAFGNRIDVSVMSQYTPLHDPEWYAGSPELGRSLTDEEYESVLDWADLLGFENLWWQEGGAVGESFIPAFDSTGVLEGEAS